MTRGSLNASARKAARRGRVRTSVASALLGAFGVALILSPLWSDPRPGAQEPPSHAPTTLRRRLLGPVAHLIGRAQWIRVEQARLRGRHDLVFAYGASALEWDPTATHGWELLAHHQALVLGSVLREPNPQRRAEWLRAGLETARRGEQAARRPERLALLSGLLLQMHAERDDPTPWPDGNTGLWRAAHAAYVRAGTLGARDADVFAGYAHDQLHAGAPAGLEPAAPSGG